MAGYGPEYPQFCSQTVHCSCGVLDVPFSFACINCVPLLMAQVVHCKSCHRHVIVDGFRRDSRNEDGGQRKNDRSILGSSQLCHVTPTPSTHSLSHLPERTSTGNTSRKKKRCVSYIQCTSSRLHYALYSGSTLKASLHHSRRLKHQTVAATASPKLAAFLTSCN